MQSASYMHVRQVDNWRDRLGDAFLGLSSKEIMLTLERMDMGWYHLVDGKDVSLNIEGQPPKDTDWEFSTHETEKGYRTAEAKKHWIDNSKAAYIAAASLPDVTQDNILISLSTINHEVVSHGSYSWIKERAVPLQDSSTQEECGIADTQMTQEVRIPANDVSPQHGQQWSAVLDPLMHATPCEVDGKSVDACIGCAQKKSLILGLFAEYEVAIQLANTDTEKLYACADFCKSYAYLHPFWDGNGRTRTFLLSRLLVQNGLHPVYMYNNNRDVFRLQQQTYRDNVVEGFFMWEKAVLQPDINPWGILADKDMHDSRTDVGDGGVMDIPGDHK